MAARGTKGRTELLETLRELARYSEADPEAAHSEADQALLNYVHDKEISQAFDAIYKWYA